MIETGPRRPGIGLRGAGRRLRAAATSWLTLAVAFALVVTFGFVGLTEYQQHVGVVEPVTGRLYASLQLFVLSGSTVGAVPWPLEIARFAAPTVAGWAVIQAAAALFREQTERLRLRFMSEAVVVIGYGGKGQLLVEALRQRGDAVVVVDANSANPALVTARAIGAVVAVGDARDPETLRRARIGAARHVAVLTGNDGVNAQIAAGIRDAVPATRSTTLNAVVHLVDPNLCLLLSTDELEHYGESPVRLDFVNVYNAAAVALTRRHWAALTGAGVPGARPGTVAVVGSSPVSGHLLPVFARSWALGAAAGSPRLQVLLAGIAESASASVAAAHPEVARFLDVSHVPDRATLVAGSPSVVFVCPSDEAEAAATALELRSRLARRGTTITVVLQRRAGLGSLLIRSSRPSDAARPATEPVIDVFGLFDETCQPEQLLSGTTEVLAQALHQAYLDAHAVSGSDQSTPDAALRPWSELPDALRESNRDQAAHVAVKLAAVGRAVVPLLDWDDALQPFPDADVEVMARLEHERWLAERRRSGWTLGPRDPVRRTNPALVPWEELPEDLHVQNRVFVRELPRLLASVGLQAAPRGTLTAVGGTGE